MHDDHLPFRGYIDVLDDSGAPVGEPIPFEKESDWHELAGKVLERDASSAAAVRLENEKGRCIRVTGLDQDEWIVNGASLPPASALRSARDQLLGQKKP